MNNFYKDFLIISDGLAGFAPSLLHDRWEEFDEAALKKYFENGYKIFSERLKTFGNLKNKLTVKEETELKFMLEALIDAKKFSQNR